ncbi:ferredoxin [Mycolicibacterium anyangense]|uniref:Ferredoxin n=1 Tax=Mycolicibacterium anyangense TaxID=1431246 RepID=A0A6N4W3K3_9MYCO|nr:ferredoxin [Mycolicibacterium anyangense]BBZ75148.1 ferredoxin [Mycolicibacterium anyangense]
MKIRVDTTKCSGIGMCEMLAPDLFEIGEDGQSHVLATADDHAGADPSLAAEAASNCPTGAITIED